MILNNILKHEFSSWHILAGYKLEVIIIIIISDNMFQPYLLTEISENQPGKGSDSGQRSLCRCIPGEGLLRNDPGSPEM